MSDVVILVHGINSYGKWYRAVESALTQPGTKVTGPKYGYFNLFSFLAPWDCSSGPIKRVTDSIRDARTLHPTARISVIAHSFGTHLITTLLTREPDIRLHRLVLCGAVIKQSFRWALVSRNFDRDASDDGFRIVNDCGDADSLPALGAAAGWRYGNAGTDGAGDPMVKDRYHVGGHGLFFDEQFIRNYWGEFIINGDIRAGSATQAQGVRRWVRILSRLPLNWALLAAGVLLAYVAFSQVQSQWLNWRASKANQSAVAVEEAPARQRPYGGVVELLVHRRSANGSDLAMDLSDPRVWPLKPGDAVKVTADIEPPAYLYLFWIDEVGVALPLHPWTEPRWGTRPVVEQKTGRLDLKAPNGNWFELSGKAPGMETLHLIARSTPLEMGDSEVEALLRDLPSSTFPGERARAWFENFDLRRGDPLRTIVYDDAALWATGPIGLQRELKRRIGGLSEYSCAVSFARIGAE